MAATASLAVGQNKYGLDATGLFTRGKPGDPEERGESMVQKHAAKLQQEKEAAAMQRMSALLPQLGEVTRMLVLQETDWVVEQAQVVAKQFMEAHADKLAVLQKARKKLLADAAAGILPGAVHPAGGAAPAAAAGSDSDQAGSSGSDSSDDSGSDGAHERRKRKHRSKKDKQSSEGKEKLSSRGSGKGSKHKKHKRSRDKERDTGGAGPGGAKALTHSENFGRFGVIRETDKSAKANEFMRWAMDVKKTSLETCGPTEERELFKAFMEDYNTGTMPHRKYYNLEIYERERAVKAAKKAAKTGVKVSERPVSALEDMEEIRRQRMAERARVETERLAEAYKDLKYKGKAQDMREQELLRAQMALAYKTGDTETAKALAKRLEPVVIDDRIPKKR